MLDLNDGAVVATLPLPTPTEARFSADGSSVAVGGNDNLVRLFDTATFTETQQLAGSPDQPFGLAFSPDGSRLVSGTTGHVRSWDLSPDGPPALGNLHVSGGFVGRFTVAADEATAIANVYAGSRTRLHRVDIATGEDEEVLTGLRLVTGIHPVVAPDLSTALALDAEFVTNVFDLATRIGTPLGSCEAAGAIDASGRLVALDGQMLCTEVFGAPPRPGRGTVSRIVDLETGRTVLDFGEVVLWGAAFGPPADGGRAGIVTVVDGDDVVTVHDLTTGAELGSYVPEDGYVLNLAMSPDGHRIASVDDERTTHGARRREVDRRCRSGRRGRMVRHRPRRKRPDCLDLGARMDRDWVVSGECAGLVGQR